MSSQDQNRNYSIELTEANAFVEYLETVQEWHRGLLTNLAEQYEEARSAGDVNEVRTLEVSIRLAADRLVDLHNKLMEARKSAETLRRSEAYRQGKPM